MDCSCSRSNNDEVNLVPLNDTDASSYETIRHVSKQTRQRASDSYTVEDVVNAGGFGKFQWKLTFMSCFAWMAESCEIMILSLLGGFLACEWKITSVQEALLTSMVFLGMGIGCPILGKMTDTYGRIKVVRVSTVILVICGILTVFSPSITWMIVFRWSCGFLIPGVNGIMVLFMEYLPTKLRGKCTLFLYGFWGVGSIVITLTAMAVMTTKNSWRVVLFISVTPLIIFLILSKWCPESARYMLAHGKIKEAEDTIIKMAEENGLSRPAGKLQNSSNTTQRKSIICLFKDENTVFFCLIFLWFFLTFVYYGIVLLTPEVILHGGLPIKTSQPANLTVPEYYMPCKPLLLSDYISLLLTTAAEILGVFFAWLLVEILGRRKLMFTFSFFYSASVMMLLIDKVPAAIPCILLFIARGSISGCFGVCVLYTNEAYPTTHRALAYGFYLIFGRFGTVVTPLVAQVLLESVPKATVVIYSVLALFAGIATFVLPLDKKGQELEDQYK
ncbi:synaptic vesicle 2-related protein-like [Limulus polyphemus]|uniref:Synaptic vesicle 2-related protein-like n=1 Tax=Limulus polyphemus TaxID=6850 RepID=A0ABM1SSW0_LIMPO|nr:synaptic vesicle 2-related protein-like [Limulus polyphemus]